MKVASSILASGVAAVAVVSGMFAGGVANAAPSPAGADDQRVVREEVQIGQVQRVAPTPGFDAAGAACYKARANGSGKNSVGGTLYTYYTVGGWCASGNRVTRAYFVDANGETKTIGWRYAGVINKGSGVVNNGGRTYAQFKFILGAGGVDVQSPTPCLRVRGHADGTATIDSVCGVN